VSERTVPGTEGPEGHELRPPVDDGKVPWRVFVVIGFFLFVIGAVYWATAYEESGTVMLLLAGGLALWVGTYLWLRQREATAAEPTGLAGGRAEAEAATGHALPGTGRAAHGEHYLPHASAWPLAIGLGGATIANGLALGLWVIVPGVALLALGIGGFVRQSRRRD
jgi:Cytochrome c oxidase subunit IV